MQQMELSAEEMDKWRKHPTTQKVLKFLNDFRAQISTNVANSIFAGEVVEEDAIRQSALRCEIMGDIIDLRASDILDFYQPQKEEKDGADKRK